ncbi:type IV pilin [Halomicrococcus sp. NG-SE-24]|uniref:type IV pilin n=1 Tax=Halomicrococcus sp. NG-SE-24 TaxID=3436928 RepID=UPI003D95DDAF
MSSRALSPAVGTVLLLVVAFVLAGGVGTLALDTTVPREPTHAALAVSADAEADRLVLLHRGGDPLSVERLSVAVRIDGTPLDHQPPVPFFAATGFRPGPTRPFNSATNETWTPGERTAIELAGTNDPLLDPGDRVLVRVRLDGRLVAEVSTTAG